MDSLFPMPPPFLMSLVRSSPSTDTRVAETPQLDLAATILFIEAREAGKRSAGVLSGSIPASSQANKAALVTEDRVQDTIGVESCRYCGRTGHGRSPNGDTRKKSCPAWDKECSKCSKKGHFKKCCQSKITAESHKISMHKMTAGIANTQNKFRRHIKHAKVVGSEIVARDKDCPKTVARNMKPLPHKVYNVKEAMYQEQLPPTNPMIKIKVQVDSKSYQNHKPRLPCGMLMSFLKKTGDQKLELDESRPLPTMELVADTGAQVDIIGVAHINKIGLVREHLLRTAVNLDCANETEATVLGVFFAKISGRSVVTGEETTTKSMVYVIKGKVCLMSKTTLTALGCLPKEFPQIGKYLDTEACHALGIANNDAPAIGSADTGEDSSLVQGTPCTRVG